MPCRNYLPIRLKERPTLPMLALVHKLCLLKDEFVLLTLFGGSISAISPTPRLKETKRKENSNENNASNLQTRLFRCRTWMCGLFTRRDRVFIACADNACTPALGEFARGGAKPPFLWSNYHDCEEGHDNTGRFGVAVWWPEHCNPRFRRHRNLGLRKDSERDDDDWPADCHGPSVASGRFLRPWPRRQSRRHQTVKRQHNCFPLD